MEEEDDDCLTDGQGSSYRQGEAGRPGQGRAGQGRQKDLANFRTWFSGLGISTLGPGFSHSRFPRPKPENF